MTGMQVMGGRNGPKRSRISCSPDCTSGWDNTGQKTARNSGLL